MKAALVLAGSRRGAEDPMAAHAGVTHKAVIEVGGRPMLARVVQALAGAGYGRIAVAIERPDLVDALTAAGAFPANVHVEVLPAAEGPSLSVAAGLERLGTPLLVTTADHALLRPEWVKHFVENVPVGADVAAGLARSEVVLAAAPGTKRTFLRFSDGWFSGCNLFYFATPNAARVVDLWREVETKRKRPIELLARLGLTTAIRYALGALSLQQATDRLERLAGAKACAVELPFGQAAIDVDKPADLALVQSLVASAGYEDPIAPAATARAEDAAASDPDPPRP